MPFHFKCHTLHRKVYEGNFFKLGLTQNQEDNLFPSLEKINQQYFKHLIRRHRHKSNDED